jgi:glycosyltransferase involved in cell wall biosynthesis
LFIHPPILAERLIRDGNNFDVGLALDSPTSINSDICVANKVFAYLMARLAIIGADTTGQKDIFSHFPQAVSIFRAYDAKDLAAAMRSYLTGGDKLLKGKQAASEAAQKYFNWETESGKLLQDINQLPD